MNNYFTIYDFMVEELGLSGNELLIYALIFSFTLNGGDGCYACQNSIAKRVGARRQTVNKCLKSLKESGLIAAKENKGSSKTKCYVSTYSTADVKYDDRLLSNDLTPACQKSRHNIKTHTQSRIRNDSNKPSFDLSKCEDLLY